MRIGDAAAAAGLTTRALRYYEQRGLLSARRLPSGHRAYDQADVDRLRNVRDLLDSGLTIGDVQAFVHVLELTSEPGYRAVANDDPGTCPVAEVAHRRLSELDERIDRLTELRERLANALTHRFGTVFGVEDKISAPASA